MGGSTNGSVLFSPVKFLYGLYDKYSERIKKQKKLLRRKWISGAGLESKDMLGNRPSYKYRPREEDEILRNMLLEEKSILVRGNALAGKTRTTFEVLKSMGSLVDVIIPLPEDIDSGDYPFADNYGMNTEIVILDDLDRFVEMSNFAKMIEVIKSKHFLIIATCQSGEKFELVSKKIDICTVFGKNIVDIGLISKGEAQRIAEREDIKWEDTGFDGTIGSVFMRLHEVRRRYDALMEREKEILQIIKKLHMCGLYEGDHLFPYALIETVYIKDHRDTELDWVRVLGPLTSSELIIVSEEKKIHVEEVYLEKIVQLNEPASKLSVLNEMFDTFSHNSAVLIGIGNKASSYSLVRIQKAEYAKVAVRAYEEALQLMVTDESPIQYAMVQHSLGIAYRNLAGMEDREHNLEKAISAHEEALKVYTFEEFPMDHAIAWNNIGLAYSDLASVKERKINLKKAIEAYEAEIKVAILKEFPMQYAMAQKNLGMAYTCMADMEDMDVNLEKAARSYGEALEIFENLKLSHHAEKVKNELAVMFRELRQED